MWPSLWRPGSPYSLTSEIIVTFMLRLPEGTRYALVAALQARGWQGKVGQTGGRPYEPRERDDKAVRKLLRHAAIGMKKEGGPAVSMRAFIEVAFCSIERPAKLLTGSIHPGIEVWNRIQVVYRARKPD